MTNKNINIPKIEEYYNEKNNYKNPKTKTRIKLSKKLYNHKKSKNVIL
jgi:hypothetical protein